jgi:hypothetical protein
VILFNTSRTIFERNIHIPFRSVSGGFTTTVRLDDVFRTTPNGLCGMGFNITWPVAQYRGCLEPVMNNELHATGWKLLSQVGRKIQLANVSTINISTTSGVSLRLHSFDRLAGESVFRPSIFTIPNNTEFVKLEQFMVQPFATAGLPIFVKCDRAQWIKRTCGIPSTTHLVERGTDGNFEVNPCVNTDLVITAVCNNPKTAFCQLKKDKDEPTEL